LFERLAHETNETGGKPEREKCNVFMLRIYS
jgi:hypothetical protein